MNGFFKVFKQELSNVSEKPKLLLLGMLVPFFLFYLYVSIFGNGVARKLPIAILDEDKSMMSRSIINQLEASPAVDITHDVDDQNEAVHLMRTMEVYGYIIIPERMETDLNRGKNVNVVLNVNNNFLTPSGLLNKAFLSSIGKIATAGKINVIMKAGANIDASKIKVMPIIQDSHALFNPFVNYTYYLNIALFPMALQMVVLIISSMVLGTPLKYDQGRELYHLSNERPLSAFMGKLLPYTFGYIIVIIIMIIYLFIYLDIPRKTSLFTIFLLLFFLVIVYQLMALFFVALSKNFRSLCTASSGYASLAFSFSGYTFPAEGMPMGIKVMDIIFPFTSFNRLFTNVVIKGMPLESSDGYLIGLFLFALLGILSLPKFGLLLKKGSYAQ